MDLSVAKKITVDFYDKKYVLINAKQYDEFSRSILVTCCNQGKIFPIDKETNFAYIRYKKPDGLNVFNTCEITNDGKILVELTKQMLADYGRSYADLVIVHKNSTDNSSNEVNDLFDVSFSDDGNGNVTIYATDFVNVNDDNNGGVTVTLTNLDDMIEEGKYSILSTMTFVLNISATAIDNKEIESSDEYNALNDLIIRATDTYEFVITSCKVSEESAKNSELNAEQSKNDAKISEEKALASENAAKSSENNAKASENNAKTSEENSKLSENNSKISEQNAKESESISILKASEALESANNAANSLTAVNEKLVESTNMAILSQSYAVGGTDSRINEDIDNSKYYYTQAKAVSDSIDGSFLPMGTITFSELNSMPKDTGYVYHVTDSFTTDDTFKSGSGISYPAGSNVYYTSDGYWDCFAGVFLTDETYNEMNQTIVKLQLYTDELSKNITNLQDYISSIEEYSKALEQRIETLENQLVLEITE